MNKKQLALLSGPLLFLLIIFLGNFKGLSNQGQMVLASVLWMAAWWTTEAVPMAMTALLPLILFPLLGVMTIKMTGANYGHPIIFLFIGGFMLAAAIEKWRLHTRIALSIILKLGNAPKTVILGFMSATAFLSMWISNTATTLMMLPIGLAVIEQLKEDSNQAPSFARPLLLGIAYSASIGGMATLIGTPTNVIFAGVVFERFGIEISFAKWLLFASPISLCLLFLCWYYLVNIAFKIPPSNNDIKQKNALLTYKKTLGKITYEEKMLLIIFGLVSLAWITRSFLLTPFIPTLSDPIIALIGAFALFIIPAKNRAEKDTQKTLLDWRSAVNIPWGIILLFGGGLSLAKAFTVSGLSAWIGLKITALGLLPLFLLLLLLIALVNFLTEITSNIATVSMILPVLASLSSSLEINPLILMIGATCAASCAFMLPIATPPNALVFGAGYLDIKDMIKAGLGLNLLSIALFTVYVYYLIPLLF